ncbi:ExbD/TolR family protein [Calothrix sp. 336/3]|uniref:ExbD/TolR family protein n=1 Tax=Calothrix sp. 336/3 TaxID=1337936 RepID=UPI0004E3FC1C|nr:biopolymer transporter ExbD [Calothrix sp. 336/3]AKG22515.1 biopolymer transporter ExbD [Calothrix sp. 336/3]
MKINLHTPVEEAQVQIIPLIDVIFCILTFFLLAALQFTRQQAINIDLPKATSGTATVTSNQGNRQILPVTIDAVGQTYVEKQPVQKEQLTEILKKYLQENPQGVLVLNASRSATYNDVVELLDILRQVGGDRVSLGIIPGSSQSTNSSFPTTVPAIPSGTTLPNVPNNINPNLQSVPGQGVNSTNPVTAPVVPSNNNSTPQR